MSTIAILDRRRNILLFLIMLVALLEAVALVSLWSRYSKLQENIPYSPHEKVFADRAINMFAKNRKLPVDTVMQGRFPVVVRTNDGRCVNIRNSSGNIGSVAIYCFDQEGRLTFQGER